VLREAFRRLTAEGMMELAPNRGAKVRRLRRTEALELLEIRSELEAFAARRPAAQMADPSLRRAFATATAAIEGGRAAGFRATTPPRTTSFTLSWSRPPAMPS
jgi:DNA-binding GntR family transcriptional regulator